MKVYLWKDYLKYYSREGLQPIYSIKPLKEIPQGLSSIDGKFVKVCCLSVKEDLCFIEYFEGDIESLDNHLDYEPICPHCGTKVSDSFELEDEVEEECSNCGSTFSITREVLVRYSTTIINRHNVIEELL